MSRYRYGLIALALLALSVTPAAASAQDAAPDPAQQAADAARLAACTAAPSPGTPLTITGKSGVSSSLPFTLDQPAYAVTWSLAAPSDRVTFMQLESVDDAKAIGSTLINATSPEQVMGGQTALYKVKPGRYYLDGRMPAGWSVTFTPIAG